MRSVSSLWGSELVIGTVWGGDFGTGDGPVWGCVVVGVGSRLYLLIKDARSFEHKVFFLDHFSCLIQIL